MIDKEGKIVYIEQGNTAIDPDGGGNGVQPRRA